MNGTRICSVSDCERPREAKGLCKRHYEQEGRRARAKPRPTPTERLEASLRLTDSGCLEWTKAVDRYGYGKIGVGGKVRKTHRLAWESANGPIPEGMQVLHRCDNPPCCNPAHLFLGTNADNMADKMAKNRHPNGSKSHCIRGHEFTPENTRRGTSGGRHCRECARLQRRPRRAK